MLKNKKIKIISVVILTSLLFLGVFFLILDITPKEISPRENPIGKTYGVSKTILEINDTRYEDEITDEISVYDFMSKLRSEGKIDFTEKNYVGMGKFIETINGIKGDKEKNWIFYVNGKKAQVGVSNYKIKMGDIVSWKYEKENF